MRQLKLFFIILLTLVAPSLAYAKQNSEGTKPRPPITLQKINGSGHTKFPKAPDSQFITCIYDGMTLDLEFVISEGISTLTVTDESPQCLTYNIDTSTLNASVSVGPLYGSIIIQLDTERGNHFSGIIE